MMPALLHSTSRPSGHEAIMSAAAERTLLKLCKSHGMLINLPSGATALTASKAAWARGDVRLSKMTLAPSFAHVWAKMSPVPEVLP
eukprot:scaffold38454_cov202-Isochrysis_galbana.AAC.2